VSLIAGVTPDLTAKSRPGELVNFVAQQVAGRAGAGRIWPRPEATTRRNWPGPAVGQGMGRAAPMRSIL